MSNNKIFIINSTGDTPTISGDICPVMANIIESCTSDNTIELLSGETIFNKNIVTPNIKIGNIIEFDGETDFTNKFLLGDGNGFTLTLVDDLTNTNLTSDDDSLLITYSGNNINIEAKTTDLIISGSSLMLTSGGAYFLIAELNNKKNITNQVTGNTISFKTDEIYNTHLSPTNGDINEDLNDAMIGVVQKIYHNDSIIPTFPVNWVKLSTNDYVVDTLNIIYAEWCGDSRVEYWIIQEV